MRPIPVGQTWLGRRSLLTSAAGGIFTSMDPMNEHLDRPDNPSPADGPALASQEMAELYVKQGNYDRGIEMYKLLLEREPDRLELREQLEDAETLANLLTVRDETQVYDKGFREGYLAGRTQEPVVSNEDKIARLNAWLGRIQDDV